MGRLVSTECPPLILGSRGGSGPNRVPWGRTPASNAALRVAKVFVTVAHGEGLHLLKRSCDPVVRRGPPLPMPIGSKPPQS